MIKPVPLLALLLFAGTAHAGDDFGDRIARAEKIERSSPVGRDYLMRFTPETHSAFEDVVSDCFADGKKGDTESFIVVFDVDVAGNITNVAVSESSDHALCYAKGIARIKAPAPPESFAEKGFPVAIELTNSMK
ncbi:hypothetical protein AB4059_00530 [Lysobacter sp. 2RAF19]